MGLFSRLQKRSETHAARESSLPPELIIHIVRIAALCALREARSFDLARLARVSRLTSPRITQMLYAAILLRSRKGVSSLCSSLKRKGDAFAAETVRGVRIDSAFASSASDDTVHKLHAILDLCSSAFIHAPSTIFDHLVRRRLRHPTGQTRRAWQPHHHDLAVNWSTAEVFFGMENLVYGALNDRVGWPLPIRRLHLAMGENVVVNKQLLRLHDLLIPGRPLSGVTHLAIDCTHPPLMYPQFLVGPIRRLLEIRGLQRVILRVAGPTCLDANLCEALTALHDPRLALDIVGMALPGERMEQTTLANASHWSWLAQSLGSADLWLAGEVITRLMPVASGTFPTN